MSAADFLALWSWYPSVLVGCAALAVGYLALVRFHPTRRALVFLAGVLVLLAALVSPLDSLSDTYLFSAHMLQHLLLILVIPPLLLVGLPRLPSAPAGRAGDWLSCAGRLRPSPVAAWFVGIGTMWVWHLPALYNATLANEDIHVVEHLSFLATSVIFWWPVLGPIAEQRLPATAAIPYLFLASAASSLLGILLAFAPAGLYPAYLHPIDEYHLLPLLRDGWGLTPAVDQQSGGLLMWIAGGPAYLFGALSALARWYSGAEEQGEFSIKKDAHGK